MGFDRDGAYAEFASVADFNLYPLPDNVSYDQASAVQVLGIGYHAVAHRSRPLHGETVAVIGAGPVGIGAALVAQSMGARVAILDLLDYRLALASHLGIPHTLNARDANLRERALGLTSGNGFDKVVECVGGFQQQTVVDATAVVKRGGLITIVGTFPENSATIPIAYLKDREIDINFSRGNFQAFAPCLDLIASGAIDPDRYISHRFPLDAPWTPCGCSRHAMSRHTRSCCTPRHRSDGPDEGNGARDVPATDDAEGARSARPGPGEVLLDVRGNGLCGTDLKVHDGDVGSVRLPRIPGHEFAGVVVEIGPDVEGVRSGDQGVVHIYRTCGQCH